MTILFRWIGACAVLAAAPAFAQAPSAAEIVSVEGKGEYREAVQTAWNAAKAKQGLFPTNYVRTLDLSRMAIVFADRTQMRLAPNSLLQIKEAGKGPDAKTTVNLNAGRSWMQSKSAPQNLRVETPTAVAAIRGTDWEMAVEPDGKSTLSVFSGEVDLSNEFGSVNVRRGEQAVAEKGKAPVKLQVVVSRDRIQWVSSVTVDPERYAGTRGLDLPAAYAKVQRDIELPGTPPEAFLLHADFEAYRGDLVRAERVLQAGLARFPGDARLSAASARLAMLAGEGPKALALARQAAQAAPNSVEAALALGDAARLEGLARESAEAYQRAIDLAAGDARGWHGLGVVEAERDNLRRGRALLARAITLDPNRAETYSEAGTAATSAAAYAEARTAFDRALAMQPENYVAWTGVGILELRTGRLEAATEALLKATLIEPRYARGHVYLGVAHYQAGRTGPALDELKRAAETDPNDPLPYILSAQIRIDAIEPAAAAADAGEALKRIPYLKSLDAIGDNQKGIANVGSALAFMGLEDWSRRAAHDSYLPLWGASHLFLADRYPGAFDRRSELMQGFLSEPLSFGASNRFQALVPAPGHHATASLRYNQSDDVRLVEPVLTANGLSTAGSMPFSYFVEGIGTKIEPGNTDFEATAKTFTVALGAKPTSELSLFLYANRLDADVDLGKPDVTGEFGKIDGYASRIDVGARYSPSANVAWWLKAGAGKEDSDYNTRGFVELPGATLERLSAFNTKPEARDAALRQTWRVRDTMEITWGAEYSRREEPKTLVRDTGLHFVGSASPQESLDQTDIDRMKSAYAIGRFGKGAFVADIGLGWHDYTKDRDVLVMQPRGNTPFEEHYQVRGTDPMGGFAWKPFDGQTIRGACRRWVRPIALDTLMPVAIAGVPLEDQLVFAGGTLRQCRAQWEWAINERSFFNAHYEEARTKNLVSPLDGVLNTRTDITNLDRLRNRVLTPPGRPDELEDTPVYAEGVAKRTHAAYERILGAGFAARAHYTYTDSENTDPLFAGKKIPWLARHHADLGLTWAPGAHIFVTLQAAWRSQRYADEANFAPVPQGWDARFNVFMESRDKRWAVEVYGFNLAKKEQSDVFGAVASWRF
jgi:tetratricopeptide (TPR) repeat protein